MDPVEEPVSLPLLPISWVYRNAMLMICDNMSEPYGEGQVIVVGLAPFLLDRRLDRPFHRGLRRMSAGPFDLDLRHRT